MAQLFEFKKVVIGPRNLDAEVWLGADAPVMTSDDPEGTKRVMALMPELADHVCLGDASEHFGGVVENTELAHLLEHVSVELLARTNIAGDVSTGQTIELFDVASDAHESEPETADTVQPAHAYRITLSCPDDVLVTGALSSAAWILQWAYTGGAAPEPDVEAIADGLVDLVASVDSEDFDPNAVVPHGINAVAEEELERAVEEVLEAASRQRETDAEDSLEEFGAIPDFIDKKLDAEVAVSDADEALTEADDVEDEAASEGPADDVDDSEAEAESVSGQEAAEDANPAWEMNGVPRSHPVR